jgi:hypothetical protein
LDGTRADLIALQVAQEKLIESEFSALNKVAVGITDLDEPAKLVENLMSLFIRTDFVRHIRPS